MRNAGDVVHLTGRSIHKGDDSFGPSPMADPDREMKSWSQFSE